MCWNSDLVDYHFSLGNLWFSELASEDIIYEGLKDREGIVQSLWHHQIFIVTQGYTEGRLPFATVPGLN